MGGQGGGAQRMLEMFDRNGDGEVTEAEIEAVRADRFAGADADGDGTLGLEEFQTIWTEMTRRHNGRRLAASGRGRQRGRHGGGVRRPDRPDDPDASTRTATGRSPRTRSVGCASASTTGSAATARAATVPAAELRTARRAGGRPIRLGGEFSLPAFAGRCPAPAGRAPGGAPAGSPSERRPRRADARRLPSGLRRRPQGLGGEETVPVRRGPTALPGVGGEPGRTREGQFRYCELFVRIIIHPVFSHRPMPPSGGSTPRG